MGIRVPPAQIDEMKHADLLVALGERMTDTVSQSYAFPAAPQPQLPFVHVWPDPIELGRVWRPDLGIPCSPHEVVKALIRARRPGQRGEAPAVGGKAPRHPSHALGKDLGADRGWRQFRRHRLRRRPASCRRCDRHLRCRQFRSSFIHRYIGFRQGQVFLSSVVGAMGSGMPMAVAAALRRPGTQVVAFVGDGGALMTGNELATACQYGANPILIIADNHMYGTIAMHSYMRYPERPFMAGTRLTNPDFAAWGRSFGAEAITIRTEAEAEAGIAAPSRSGPVRWSCIA